MSGAFGGLVIWAILTLAAALGAASIGAIEALLLLAPLVLAPLGLEIARSLDPPPSPAGALARVVVPIGALFAAASFWIPARAASGWLAAWWAVACAIAALDGLWRLARGGYRSVEGVCSSASFLYLLVGSVWLVLSRRGATPFGYPALTVLLAAVHFHFTGFALPLVAGATARAEAAGGTGRRLFRPVIAAILAGPAILAVGNVRRSPSLKLAGALLLFVASAALAVRLLSVLRRVRFRPARTLLAISAVSLAAGMALAAVYALGELLARDWLLVPDMVRIHGAANALGFALCGLLGWALEVRRAATEAAPRLAPGAGPA
jgi:hypothetical protein